MKNRKFKTPHTYAMLLGVIIFVSVLTYVIPSGTFDRVEKQGQTLVVPESFQYIKQHSVGFFDIFRAIPEGLMSGGEIVFYVLLVGGAFGILHQSKVLESGLNHMIYKLGHAQVLMIPLTMIIFSILGFSISLAEETIIFVPIGILVARTLGYDALTGAAMIILGAASGFIGGMLNPFTVGVAQKVAEIPLFSGWGFRSIVYVFILAAAITVVMRYAKRVKRDPSRSLVYELEQSENAKTTSEVADTPRLTTRQWLALILFVGVIVLNVYGIFQFEWSFTEMSANFLMTGIVVGLILGMGVNGTFEALVEGMKSVLFGAMIVGFAKGIVVILEDGKIIDTIVHAMAVLLQDLPNAIVIVAMFILQFFLNFFIPSGSGQALTTMPLMVPISDLLDINRQLTVLAFQYGDAISNSLFPTSAVLMGALAVAKVSYTQWIKFIWKLILLWVLICAIALTVGVMIGY